MKAITVTALNMYNQIVIGESDNFRLFLDSTIFFHQHIYYTSATMLFFVVNGVASIQLSSIQRQVRQPDLQENHLFELKKSYFKCNLVVNEISDTFGVVMLVGMVHDFLKIINEGMYTAVNQRHGSQWQLFILDTFIILLSLANLTLINFSGQHLNRQVVSSNEIITNWRYVNFSLLQGRAAFEGNERTFVFAAEMGRKSQRFYQLC